MDLGFLAQHLFNGLMLGVIYAMIAVGFSLFFGVLDVIKFSHGDVVTLGAFAALGAAAVVGSAVAVPGLALALGLLAAIAASMAAGALIGGTLVLPLRNAPPVNVLLVTLMAGTILREAIRLGVPNGGNPKPFPALLPDWRIAAGSFSVGVDSVAILLAGVAVIVATRHLVTRTRLGLAIRAVAQDPEVACLSGIDFRRTVLGTFALGSALAGIAGCMLGLYYREINFGMGLVLGVIGFAAAVVGGLGSLLGPILGGFLFAGVQTLVTITVPAASAYKDVAAFAVVIAIIGILPTGLISERSSERV
ncbi:amino acid/amide ABC transporter membrane protein 1, HAAT family [Methylobacterium sp. 190mf]|uniref:branched-chain amino acid ABC transporter permease n=1 Tax=Methylobacterium sp. 190mf TaxID=1761798 RepID=UPI00089EAAD3|nr:branched-chain amino acid ABC transporter permease [Methylobacterium sp. 190mf]RTL15639.1 MAG: branched-chain amino acid ABC transporter permease [Sphingomonadaceae bacterium]SEG70524.1 amino acid/amide ABC transporter membrane protein 1, HAAT family [Methylobacterium sp. 190mf]